MSDDYTFLRNDQLKIMEDELNKARIEIRTHKRAFSHYLLDSGVRSAPKRVKIIDKYLQKARKEE